MAKKFIKTIGRVTLNGDNLKKGSVIELDDEHADNLVDGNFAAYCNEDGETLKAPAAKAKKPADGTIVDADKVRNALDTQYKADELKSAAKEAGVEFAFDATKAQVIEAVIAQDKAAALLK
jgi:hypothetical protein